MTRQSSTAIAHPNIALIKYWGNAVPALRLPANGSISFNLGGLFTKTTIFESARGSDHQLFINDREQANEPLTRMKKFLESFGKKYPISGFLKVDSHNNFPMGTGIASSASAFASLAIALNDYFSLGLSEAEISAAARLGSGSACRSIPAGITEWKKGSSHETSFASSIAAPDHWPLRDCIVVVDQTEKKIGSTEGHQLANSSPYQSTRINDSERRLSICRKAIMEKDFEELAHIIELDSDMMHAVMMTSNPPLHYWQAASLSIMQKVRELRASGIACAYTMDAGPNVHIIHSAQYSREIETIFSSFHGVPEIFMASIGGAAHITPKSSH